MKQTAYTLLFMLLVLSCNKTPKENKTIDLIKMEDISFDSTIVSKDSIVGFLISATISDFKKQPKVSNPQFRNSHIGYKLSETGEKVYLLCGEFIPEPNKTWVPFATLKTSGYEQWQGVQALSLCQDSTVIWDKDIDVSELIHKKFLE